MDLCFEGVGLARACECHLFAWQSSSAQVVDRKGKCRAAVWPPWVLGGEVFVWGDWQFWISYYVVCYDIIWRLFYSIISYEVILQSLALFHIVLFYIVFHGDVLYYIRCIARKHFLGILMIIVRMLNIMYTRCFPKLFACYVQYFVKHVVSCIIYLQSTSCIISFFISYNRYYLGCRIVYIYMSMG